MSDITIFSRLCAYSLTSHKLDRENFLTESMAYLFEKDSAFKECFLDLILRDPRIRRRFNNATISTQGYFNHSRVDLVLESPEHKLILIEVKIKASETRTQVVGVGRTPQVQKYLGLKKGHVAFLASIQAPEPEVTGQKYYLGRFDIEKLHEMLSGSKDLSALGKEFVIYLKEQRMAYSEPLTPEELGAFEKAFSYAEKSINYLDKISEKFQPVLVETFGERIRFSRAIFSPSGRYTYSTLKGRDMRKLGFAWAGISIERICEVPSYTFSVEVSQKDDSLKRAQRIGFKELHKNKYWGLSVELQGGNGDSKSIENCTKLAINRLKKLK